MQEFCEIAFGHVGLELAGHVVQDERFMRPAEVDLLIGDPAKAKRVLGWEPADHSAQLVEMMVEGDMELVARQQRV